jgi:hypothetical protein
MGVERIVNKNPIKSENIRKARRERLNDKAFGFSRIEAIVANNVEFEKHAHNQIDIQERTYIADVFSSYKKNTTDAYHEDTKAEEPLTVLEYAMLKVTDMVQKG